MITHKEFKHASFKSELLQRVLRGPLPWSKIANRSLDSLRLIYDDIQANDGHSEYEAIGIRIRQVAKLYTKMKDLTADSCAKMDDISKLFMPNFGADNPKLPVGGNNLQVTLGVQEKSFN